MRKNECENFPAQPPSEGAQKCEPVASSLNSLVVGFYSNLINCCRDIHISENGVTTSKQKKIVE